MENKKDLRSKGEIEKMKMSDSELATLLNSEQSVQVSDTTEADSSNAAGNKQKQPIEILKQEWLKVFDEGNWNNFVEIMPETMGIIMRAMELYSNQNKQS